MNSVIIGGSDGPTSIFVNGSITFVALICGLMLFMVVGRVLLAMAVYYDACSKSNKDAVMWALLVGFLGLIPGIIYLCVRNNVKNYVLCQQCGFTHFISEPKCPRCGADNPYYAQSINPMAAKQAHQAKIMLIISLILLAIGIIGAFIGVVLFMQFIFSMTGSGVYIH